jgi:hypothetical protein
MTTQHLQSKQPVRETWTRERLDRERAIALGQAIDTSTWSNYSSALHSYLDFVNKHSFSIEPTPDTLSYYAVYMSYHIKPDSVDTYLSGICQQLEPFFPDVRKHRKSLLVNRTLKGCKRLHISPTKRKRALTRDDLLTVINHYRLSSSHDDLLFVAQLLVGFFALMRLGELTTPDDVHLRNPSKVSKRTSVVVNDDSFQFFLPSHKADKFFEGNTIVLLNSPYSNIDTFAHFRTYLSSRDRLFPYSSPLWLTRLGSVPTRSFFLQRLHLFFGDDVAGQSLRAGGATDLAIRGTPPSLIQAAGRWTSESFRIYVRKSPILIHALKHNRASSSTQPLSPILHQD